MSYQLQRGQNISLTRLAASLSRVAIGLGWDANASDGAPINLDASAFMLDSEGKVVSDAYFIFFNQLTSPDGAVEHQGNNETGVGAGDDEVILVNLPQVSAGVEKIVFTVTIYDAEALEQTFGLVNNAYIRILNLEDEQEILRYNLTERFDQETAMVFGELYRHQGDWKFRAVGQGYNGGLQAMADTYGVNTDDEPAPPAEEPPADAPQVISYEPDPEVVAAAPAFHEMPTVVMSPEEAEQSLPKSQPVGFHELPTIVKTAEEPTPFEELPTQTTGIKQGRDGIGYELLYPGAYTLLKVHLAQGKSVKAEAGAMVAMDATIDLKGKMEGGILGGMARTFLTGESFFLQNLVAERGDGWAVLGQAAIGDIQAVDLDGSVEYTVQKDGFLAGTDGLKIATTMQNLFQGFASGEGFFVIKIKGTGTLFMSSYGAIHPIDLEAGEELIVDNHHLVAWPTTTQYTIELAAGLNFSSLTSGELLVCRFRGPGRIFIQSRNPMGFVGWLAQFAPDLFPDQAAGTAGNLAQTAVSLLR